MGGNYSRLTTWGAAATLTAAALNAEFDNVLTNFIPTMMASYSANATQMQIQTSPGNVGSESLATALSGELERLRYMLASIAGTTYWYQTPVSSIAALNNALGAAAQANKVSSGLTAATTGISVYLVPSGSTNLVTAAGSVTPLVYTITSGTYTISSNITLAGLPTTGSVGAAIQMTVSDTSITSGQSWTQLIGENGSTISVATVGSSITPLAGKIVAFKNQTSSELLIGRLNAGSTALYDVSRSYYMNSASAFTARSNLTNGDVLQLLALNWIYATTAGTLTTAQTNPTYANAAPSAPSNGDYWFDMVNNLWKTFNGSTWVSANATLIGICVCDNSKAIGTRSIDPFANFQPSNTAELLIDGNALIRTRWEGASASIFGNVISFPKGYATWTQALYEGGNATAAVTSYYLYLAPSGGTYISTNAPYNRPDLAGYYHPSAQFRCLGYVTTDLAGNFSVIESFYKTNLDFAISSATAALTNFPQPYIIPPRQQMIKLNAASGAITQIVPHPAQWAGQRLIYMKTDSSVNLVTLQAFGNSVLVTTGNVSQGTTSILTLAATTGLNTGINYLVSGAGIPWGTTASFTSGTTANLTQTSFFTTTGTAVTFATTPVGVGFQVGNFTTTGTFTLPLATCGEAVELMSDGLNIIVLSHTYPTVWQYAGACTIGATTTVPTKGTILEDAVWYRRNGSNMDWRLAFRQGAAGSVGAGDYLPQIPGGYSADITKITVDTTVLGNANYGINTSNFIGGGILTISTTNTDQGSVVLYSATQARFFVGGLAGGTGIGAWSSTAAIGGLGTATVGVNFYATTPMKDWW